MHESKSSILKKKKIYIRERERTKMLFKLKYIKVRINLNIIGQVVCHFICLMVLKVSLVDSRVKHPNPSLTAEALVFTIRYIYKLFNVRLKTGNLINW